MTPYQSFVQRWSSCTACELCHVRRHVVLSRGVVPCDVCFIGEAPGPSENKLGVPFIGPAGKLLDQIIAQAEQRVGRMFRKAFTNLISCFPKNVEEGKKWNEPPAFAIKACAPRLMEFVKLCKPRLIVLVGRLAEKYTPLDQENVQQLQPIPKRVAIVHPAAILRAEGPQRPLLIKQSVLSLAEAFALLL